MNRVLMIAYHFPPVSVSSGVHRSLYFVKHLPEHGWNPVVLTVNPRAYIRSEESLIGMVPRDVPVVRSFALDASRHLAIKGRYLGVMAIPDQWQSWWLSGVLSGLRLIRRYRPRVLWSTFPIATATLIGLTLHKLSRLPWVADFRDPMGKAYSSADSRIPTGYRTLERKIVCNASAVVLTTPRTTETYRLTYHDEPASKWRTIENGFDEELFDGLEGQVLSQPGTASATLVHSGVLYQSGRNPIPFFDALKKLFAENKVTSKDARILLRASGSEDFYRSEISRRNLESVVTLAPPLGYKEALREMLSASGLLLFQGAAFNNQIPAKAYEYLRSGRPILALVDPRGETAQLLKRAECNALIVAMDDVEQIADAIPKFLRRTIAQATKPVETHIWSRSAGCRQLGQIFNEVAALGYSRVISPSYRS